MVSASDSRTPAVDFWFDPVCPFTWITSRWVNDVATQKSFEVNWRPFSLKYLNEKGGEPDTLQSHIDGNRMGRITQYVHDNFGAEKTGELYVALASQIHGGPRDSDGKAEKPETTELISTALQECGLDAGLISIGDDANADVPLQESTDAALKLVGKGVGIPIIAVDGKAFFGPVINKRPRGENALKLWDIYLQLLEIPEVFEIKRQFKGPFDFS